jgi:hypothetical protein
MDLHTVALFGEAEKGAFQTLFHLTNLMDLNHYLGNPPPYSEGIPNAIEILYKNYHVLYIRVEEEGVALRDYYLGLKLLETEETSKKITAIMMPGVSDNDLIERCSFFCRKRASIILMNEKDLYDHLTN